MKEITKKVFMSILSGNHSDYNTEYMVDSTIGIERIVAIKDLVITEEIEIDSSFSTKDNIVLSNVRFKYPIIFSGGTFSGDFKVQNDVELHSIIFNDVSMNTFEYYANTNLDFRGGSFKNLLLYPSGGRVGFDIDSNSKNNSINNLVVQALSDIPTKIELLIPDLKINMNRWEIRRLLIDGLSKETVFNSDYKHFSEFRLSGDIEGKAKIMDIDGKGLELKFIRTNAGKIKFINCDFSESLIFFENSSLLNSSFINTKFPSKRKYEKSIKQKFLFYSQLKVAYSNGGDSTNSLLYRAVELGAKYRELKWLNNFSDKFILFIGRFTNNYGTNWLQALLVLLVISFINFNYYIYLSCGDALKNIVLYLNVLEYLGMYLEYLNPLHKSNYIFNNLNHCNQHSEMTMNLFDNLSRIINSFLIYQFLRAFRKYKT